MGFLKKLFGAAAAAGTGAAAVKVADKVKENNPNGVGDSNNDGKVDYADYIVEVEKAAKELYGEAAPKVKEAAQEKIEALKAANPEAMAKIEDVIAKVKDDIGVKD